MKNLTKEQIQGVINWMNEYEMLENTHIPIRFKEHFGKHLNIQNVSVSSPLIEGKTKGNIKNTTGKYRKAPPPPPGR